jgi:outer membrane receptor protein involved in Fe transport
VGPTALDTFGQPELRLTNLATITNGGRSVDRRLDQELMTFGDTLTWITGGHTLKGGFDTVRNRAIDGFTANRGNPRGRIDYTGSNQDPFMRLLLGRSPNDARYNQALRGALDASNWEHGLFVVDDWKIRPRITINLGMRYELITPFVGELRPKFCQSNHQKTWALRSAFGSRSSLHRSFNDRVRRSDCGRSWCLTRAPQLR